MSDYNREKWIYVPDSYLDYRYILGTRGEKPLICIGINPSTAEPDKLDPTLKSVQRIALANGYDSFIMFNVYPQRSTDPNNMHPRMDPELHAGNMQAFSELAISLKSPSLWAAWGTIIEKRSYLPFCLEEMVKIGKEHDARWFCAGKCSKKGHPHHPLYLKKDEPLREFNIDEYIAKSISRI